MVGATNKPHKKHRNSRSLASVQQFNCCFQQTQIDKGDYNLSCADGTGFRQKLVLTLVAIILPAVYITFFSVSKRAVRKKTILTLYKGSSPNRLFLQILGPLRETWLQKLKES